MDRSKKSPSHASDHWERYWRNSGGEQDAAVTGASRSHTFKRFWDDLFRATFVARVNEPLALADLACGAGAVVERALAQAKERSHHYCNVVGVDYSLAAAANIKARFHSKEADVSGVVADLSNAPFASGAFDIVTSQFGVEYAGRAALEGAAAYVAPKGEIVCVVHYSGGAIDAECTENENAAVAILESGVFDAAARLFAGDINASERLAALRDAILRLRDYEALRAPSAGLALLKRLSQDLVRVVERRAAFHPGDILGWIKGNQAEVVAYRDRMASMRAAALSKSDVDAVLTAWRGAGLDIVKPTTLSADAARGPAAWCLRARRGEG